jgi:hemerythrin
LADEFNTSGSSQDLAEEVLAMTQNWLVDHILDEDSHYAKHVKPLLK